MEVVLFARISDELVKLLDARVAEERAKRPGVMVSRADVVREILHRELGE